MRRPASLRTCLAPPLVLFGTLVLWLAACGNEQRAPVPIEEDPDAPQADTSGVGLTPAESKALDQRVAASILLVGGHLGRHKPCGCTKPQMGGVERLAALYDRLMARANDTVLGLSLGWTMAASGEAQEEAKAEFIRGVFEELKFQGVMLGDTDLQVPAMHFSMGAGGLLTPIPPINVIPGPNSGLEGRSNVLDVLFGRYPVRVATVVDPNADAARTLKALGTVREVLGLTTAFNQVKADPKTLWIVAARLHDKEQYQAIQTALRGQGPAIVVDLSGGLYADQDAIAPRPLNRDLSMLVSIDEKGKDAGVLDLLVDENNKVSVQYRRFPLRPAYDKMESATRKYVKEQLGYYKDTVRERDYLGDFATIELRGEARYVGHSKCSECHRAVYRDWTQTAHARAIPTLEKIHYEHDPECIRCHVVGFARMPNAAGGDSWFREHSGFQSVDKTPLLGGVQCENCHGPGSLHIVYPTVNKMWTSKGGVEAWKSKCFTCHDPENSPDFIANAEWYFKHASHADVPSDKRKPGPDWRNPSGGPPKDDQK